MPHVSCFPPLWSKTNVVQGRNNCFWKVVHPMDKNIHPTPINHCTGWLSRVIALIWIHCLFTWIDRKQILHGHNCQTRTSLGDIALRFVFEPCTTSGTNTLSSCTACFTRPCMINFRKLQTQPNIKTVSW
jgi:hypothetical protein